MRYRWKLALLRRPRFNLAWRRWQARRGRPPGDYRRLYAYIDQHARGRTFVDVGCMWGVNGAHAFAAEAAGAASVKAVDVFGPTPEFEAEHARRQSRVEFLLGDIAQPATLDRVGETDIVFCAGVLYHHPSPFDLLVALRRICRALLILRTSTIPEIDGVPNAAIYYPMLDDRARRMWDLRGLGLQHQAGITTPFDPREGYGNWFWGLTPSCLVSMLTTAGFAVTQRDNEAFAQTIVAEPVGVAFAHRLPGESESRAMARAISTNGIAKPA